MILQVSVFTNFDNITTKDTLGILMDMSHMSKARGLEGKPAQTNATSKRLFTRMGQNMSIQHPFVDKGFGTSKTSMIWFFEYDHWPFRSIVQFKFFFWHIVSDLGVLLWVLLVLMSLQIFAKINLWKLLLLNAPMKWSQNKFLIDQALTAALVNQRNTIYGKKYLLSEESKIFFYVFIVVKFWDFFSIDHTPCFRFILCQQFCSSC